MAKVTLVAIDGPMRGREWHFTEADTWVFGRAPDCHARLDASDQTLSRHHFLLEVRPPVLRVRDLGSRNGTYINDEKIGARARGESPASGRLRSSEERVLQDGDEIRVGASRFCVRVSRSPSERAELVRCGRCGASVLREVHATSPTARCDACMDEDARDPLAALERAIESAAKRDSTPNSKDLAAPTLAGERRDPKRPPEIEGLEVVRKLGEGGTGAVYEAIDREGNRLAVKVLLARVAVDSGMRALFFREMDSLAAVEHPRIVKLVRKGSSGVAFWFAMELCQGGSLAALIGRSGKPLEPKRAVSIVADALEGLAFAHERGMVHRDVKPGNMLIDENGRGKISDFGLAKSFDRAGLSGFTMTGSFAGTFEFMPREQLTNFRNVRPTSDVFSAGATLYWALTRKTAVDFAPNIDRVTALLQTDPTPLSTRAPLLPAELCAIVDRACAIDPSTRYRDAGELLDALRSLKV